MKGIQVSNSSAKQIELKFLLLSRWTELEYGQNPIYLCLQKVHLFISGYLIHSFARDWSHNQTNNTFKLHEKLSNHKEDKSGKHKRSSFLSAENRWFQNNNKKKKNIIEGWVTWGTRICNLQRWICLESEKCTLTRNKSREVRAMRAVSAITDCNM